MNNEPRMWITCSYGRIQHAVQTLGPYMIAKAYCGKRFQQWRDADRKGRKCLHCKHQIMSLFGHL